MGSKMLCKQEYFRSSQLSSPNCIVLHFLHNPLAITLNSIQTDRPVYEPLFAQKIKDPKHEEEQHQYITLANVNET